jgi:hypothetical protein
VPLGTLFVIESIIEFQSHRSVSVLYQSAYLALSALTVFVLLPTLYWMVLFIGLRVHNKTRVSFVAVIAVLAWNFGPSMVQPFIPHFLRGTLGVAVGFLRYMSPWRIIAIAETGFVSDYPLAYYARGLGGFKAALAGLAMNAVLLFVIRRMCLKNADRYLGRPPSIGGTE